MTLLYKERKTQNKNSSPDNFIGTRIERGKFYRIIDSLICEMTEKKDVIYFSNIMDVVYDYSNILIFEDNYSEAYKSYFHIYCKLMYGNYLDETRDFITSLDKVELYFNLGIIAKECLKDFDAAMYYFGEAGREYSIMNKVPIETFFRDQMIDKQGAAFWNFSGNLRQNCLGYSSFAIPFHYKSVFGYEAKKTAVETLLKDFDYPLLLQFVFTVSSYFTWLSLMHNIIKGVKITRVLGEMSWLFECYLKQKLSINKKTLKPLLDEFVKNKLYKESYHNLYKLEVKTRNSIEAIEALINKQESSEDIIEKQALCLLTTYVMRNYTSHNLNDKFYTFDDDKYTKKIFFSCLLSFFIVLQDIV